MSDIIENENKTSDDTSIYKELMIDILDILLDQSVIDQDDILLEKWEITLGSKCEDISCHLIELLHKTNYILYEECMMIKDALLCNKCASLDKYMSDDADCTEYEKCINHFCKDCGIYECNICNMMHRKDYMEDCMGDINDDNEE